MAALGAIVVLLVMLCVIEKYWEVISPEKVRLSMEFNSNRITEGDSVRLAMEVVNDKLMPLPLIKLSMKVPAELKKNNYILRESYNWAKYDYTVLTSLLCYQRVKKTAEFTATKRGYYTVDEKRAELNDLFGIKKTAVECDGRLDIIVHPVPGELGEMVPDYNSLQGDEIVRRWIMPDPILYSGVRQYDINDSFRDIDWKASAKLGELYVKKYDYTADPSVMIFYDVSTDRYEQNITEDSMERCIRLAAAVVEQCCRMKVPVGMATNSYMKYMDVNISMPESGDRQFIMLYDMLACMTAYRCASMEIIMDKCIRGLLSNNTFVFIAYEINERLYDVIGSIQRYNNKTEVIVERDNGRRFDNPNISIHYMT